VLFLCTANSARSQIAEALLARKGGGRVLVASAGVAPASRVDPRAVAVLAEVGIDWSAALPKHVDAVADRRWDLVITTCDGLRERCPALQGRPVYAHWGVPDPAESVAGLEAFRETARLLAWRIDLMLALRPEGLDRAVAEHRLNAIGRDETGATSPVALGHPRDVSSTPPSIRPSGASTAAAP
jgi:protein-tyrosine-phosphatase